MEGTRMREQRSTAKDRKQHLYLAFDDWDSGYTIRKVSLSRRSAKRKRAAAAQPLPSVSGDGAAEPLPGVFMSIRAPRASPECFTSAFGTKIVAMHPVDIADVPMIDVQERSFIFGSAPNCRACPIYFPVGDDRLFSLDIARFDFHLWTTPETGPWVWRDLTYPPLDLADVSSYAVQPDGCILVSTEGDGTFVFDTKEYVWRRYGDWELPFTGRGYYDTSLEGFVGISKHPETLGYIYCCAMAGTGTGGTGKRLHPSRPDLKCSKEKVYSKNPAERHVSATLLHMRPGEFCLVECVSIGDGRADQELREPRSDQEFFEPWAPGGVPKWGCFMYRLKTFCLEYDAKGDLKLTHCRVRCYSLPHEATVGFIRQDPVAFWL